MSKGAAMKVRAHVRVAGLTPGQVEEVDPSEPVIAAALASGLIEDITPRRAAPARPQAKVQETPRVEPAGSDGSGSGE